MNYGNSSTSLNNELTSFRTDILNLNGVSFNGWSGSAKDSYYSSFNKNMSDLQIEFEKVGIFSELLAQVEVYKKRKEEIESLQSKLSSLPNDEKYAAERASLAAAISQLQAENAELKAALNSAFASFGGVGTKVNISNSLFNFSSSQNATIRLEFDINSLLATFQSGKLHYFNHDESLYDYYGGDEAGKRAVQAYHATRTVTDRCFIITNDPTVDEDHAIRIPSCVKELLTPLHHVVFFQLLAHTVSTELRTMPRHPLFAEYFHTKIDNKSEN